MQLNNLRDWGREKCPKQTKISSIIIQLIHCCISEAFINIFDSHIIKIRRSCDNT